MPSSALHQLFCSRFTQRTAFHAGSRRACQPELDLHVLQDTGSDLQLFAILSVTLVVTGGLLKGSVIKFFDALLPLNDVSNEGAWWRNFYQVSQQILLHGQRRACAPAIVAEAAHTHSSPNLQRADAVLHRARLSVSSS
jgi:hypothetical protein